MGGGAGQGLLVEKVNSDSPICLALSSEGAALVPRPHFTDGNTEGQRDEEPKAHRVPALVPVAKAWLLAWTKATFHQDLKSVSNEGHRGRCLLPLPDSGFLRLLLTFQGDHRPPAPPGGSAWGSRP